MTSSSATWRCKSGDNGWSCSSGLTQSWLNRKTMSPVYFKLIYLCQVKTPILVSWNSIKACSMTCSTMRLNKMRNKIIVASTTCCQQGIRQLATQDNESWNVRINDTWSAHTFVGNRFLVVCRKILDRLIQMRVHSHDLTAGVLGWQMPRSNNMNYEARLRQVTKEVFTRQGFLFPWLTLNVECLQWIWSRRAIIQCCVA